MIERSELAVTKLGRSRKGAWIEIPPLVVT